MSPMDGLQVVGFEGIVGPRQTPARCAAVHVDGERRLVDIEHDESGAAIVQTTDVVFDGKELPGRATVVAPLQARDGWLFVIVGDRELAHRQRFVRSEAPVVRRLVTALGDDPPDPACERRLTEGRVALYLAPEDAAVLWRELNHVARAVVTECWRSEDLRSLDDAAWWLKNTATHRDDVLLALAALVRADSRYVRDLARAYFPEEDAQPVLARASVLANRELDLVETEVLRRPAAGGDPALAWAQKTRRGVRAPFSLEKRAA
jgi:hypothetical protein